MWEEYRRGDGTIDLSKILDGTEGIRALCPEAKLVAYEYVKCVEQMHRIRSRQAAAIAIASASGLAAIVDSLQ